MKKILFIWASLLPFLCFAQNAHITFNKTYGGNDTMNMLAQAVVPVDSGYLVFGNYATTSIPYGLGLTQIDQQGNVLQFNNIDSTSFFDNMGIYWGAEALVENNGVSLLYGKGKDISLVKFNFNGDTLWYKRLLKIGWQAGEQIIKIHDNGYMIAGLEVNLTQDTVRGYVLRIDSVGNFLWDKTYTMGNDARFFSIQATPWDGGYILGGMGYTPATGYDMFVVKTDSIGDTLWTRRYGGQYWDCGATIVPLTTLAEYNAGSPVEYLLSGCWYPSSDPVDDNVYLAKLDSVGNVVWQRTHDNLYYRLGAVQTPLIIRQGKRLIGCSYYFSGGFIRSVILAFKADGTIEWSKPITLNPTKDCYIKDMRPTEDGGYVLAGYQYDTPQTAWVMKVDSLGNTCSFVGCDSTIYTGYPIGLTQIANNNNWSVTPNPSNEQVFITPYFTEKSATFILYNLLGRVVQQVGLGSGTVQVSVSGLPAGTYFYQIINPQKQILQHDKLIVLH